MSNQPISDSADFGVRKVTSKTTVTAGSGQVELRFWLGNQIEAERAYSTADARRMAAEIIRKCDEMDHPARVQYDHEPQ